MRTRARRSLDSETPASLDTRAQIIPLEASIVLAKDGYPGAAVSQDNENDGTYTRKRRRTENEAIESTSKRQSKRSADKTSLRPSLLPQYESPTYTGRTGSAISQPRAARHAINAAREFLKTERGEREPGYDATLPIDGQTPQGISTLLSRIIEYNEAVIESPAGRKGKNRIRGIRRGFEEEASELRAISLPILDYLSTRILGTLIGPSFEETLANTTRPDTKASQEYSTLKSLFELVKLPFSLQGFISSPEVVATQALNTSIVRRANLATFMLSLFGGQDLGWCHLNQEFMSLFVRVRTHPTEYQLRLLVELKIQAYIAAVAQGDLTLSEVHKTLFPPDFKQQLLSWYPEAKELSLGGSDLFFKADESSTKVKLDPEGNWEDISAEKHPLDSFLRDLHQYTKEHYEEVVGVPLPVPHQPNGPKKDISHEASDEKGRIPYSEANIVDIANEPSEAEVDSAMLGRGDHGPSSRVADFSFDPDLSPLQAQAVYQQPTIKMPSEISANLPSDLSQAQQPNQSPYFFSQGQSSTFDQGSQYPILHNMQQFSSSMPNVSAPDERFEDQETPSHATQSAPTQILYERARQAATAKASPGSRRPGSQSQRRPWTQEEENALMAGLDRVKGPHWSQILGMFGPGGSTNEVLKDRNQVQLKDKARNLKLFFLKSGHEVPYYLQFVTGELKTRAPAQAAKNEARQKEKLSEERAHVQGIMALADTASTQGGDQGAKSAEDAEGSLQDAEGSPDGNTEINTSTSAPRQSANIAPMFPVASFSAEFQAQLAAAAAAATGEAPQ